MYDANDTLRCDWCSEQITSITMLHIDLWATLSNGHIADIMCCTCIHNRLGRKPTDYDRRKPWWET